MELKSPMKFKNMFKKKSLLDNQSASANNNNNNINNINNNFNDN